MIWGLDGFRFNKKCFLDSLFSVMVVIVVIVGDWVGICMIVVFILIFVVFVRI